MTHNDVDEVLAENFSKLALNVLRQAFQDIKCYYYGVGNKADRYAGRSSISWIRQMKGNFRIIAMATTTMTLEELHQRCLQEINSIKTYGRSKVYRHDKTGEVYREPDLSVVPQERRQAFPVSFA